MAAGTVFGTETTLTRVPCPVSPSFWEIRYGDIPVGRYGPRNGIGSSVHWTWSAGFYPGMDLKRMRNGTKPTEDEAREAFRKAWEAMLPEITDEMIEEYRTYSRRQGWIREMRAKGLRLPTMNMDGKAVCFCGEAVTIAGADEHVAKAHAELRG